MTRVLRSHADVVEDVTFLMESGETHPEAVANRLGMSCSGVAQACYRAGRSDLARTFNSEALRARDVRRRDAGTRAA